MFCTAHLELYDNKLSGKIPEELYDATSLTRIRINNNTLEGTLSAKLLQLADLEEIRLGYNSFSGPIPEELYQMPNMVDFRCQGAQLTGTLSNSIGDLNATLRRVFLRNNSMTGPLPIAGIEKLLNLSKFVPVARSMPFQPLLLTVFPSADDLVLDGNDFTGTITQKICDEKVGGRFFDLQRLTVSPRVDCSVQRFCCDLIA